MTDTVKILRGDAVDTYGKPISAQNNPATSLVFEIAENTQFTKQENIYVSSTSEYDYQLVPRPQDSSFNLRAKMRDVTKNDNSAKARYNNIGLYDFQWIAIVTTVIPVNGGGNTIKTRTNKKVQTKKGSRVVYKGPRGGEYIKMNGGFVSLRKL